MERLTGYDENGNVFPCEEERLLSTSGVISKDDMYKIMMHLAEKLAGYEDLEEQGRLLRLPCAVGDTVYRINGGAKDPIIPMEVCEVGILFLKKDGYVIQITCLDGVDNGETYYLSTDFNKAVFFTKREAEQVLEDLEGKKWKEVRKSASDK